MREGPVASAASSGFFSFLSLLPPNANATIATSMITPSAPPIARNRRFFCFLLSASTSSKPSSIAACESVDVAHLSSRSPPVSERERFIGSDTAAAASGSFGADGRAGGAGISGGPSTFAGLSSAKSSAAAGGIDAPGGIAGRPAMCAAGAGASPTRAPSGRCSRIVISTSLDA